MQEIRNKTPRPLRVPLPGGKVLHLGPRAVGQVADGATELPGFQALVDEGKIEVLGEGERPRGSSPLDSGPEETHGRAKSHHSRGHGEKGG